MASESLKRSTMKSGLARSEYVGALLEGERRLMLVPVTPERPWDAFRQLRRALRRQQSADAVIGLFESETPIEHQADVITLESRRRAG